jgi:ATP-dependent Clp protease ATP-binding subunit ClpB
MRFDRFTTKLQEALAQAQSLALGQDNQYIEPQHLLGALLEDQGIAGLIAKAGGNAQVLKKNLGDAISRLPKVEGTPGEVHISGELAQLLNVADKEAQKRGDQYIASELFLLAAAADKGETGRLLKQSGVTKPTLEKAIQEVRGGESVSSQQGEEQRQALAKYTLDLTERARQGKLDPVIGRDDESRGSARPRSWKGSRSASSTAKFPRASRTSACWYSTWQPSSRARSTAASSRSG